LVRDVETADRHIRKHVRARHGVAGVINLRRSRGVESPGDRCVRLDPQIRTMGEMSRETIEDHLGPLPSCVDLDAERLAVDSAEGKYINESGKIE
jgi:hypothetical protein